MQNKKLLEICAAFQIPSTGVEINQLKAGLVNTTYRLTIPATDGKGSVFLLQKINKKIFTRPSLAMENMVLVGKHLQYSHYPRTILMPLPAKQQQFFFQTADGDYWRIFPFWQNTQTFRIVENEEIAYEAAFAFGEYLRYLSDMNPHRLHHTIPHFHDTRLRQQQLLAIWKMADTVLVKKSRTVFQRIGHFFPLTNELEKVRLPLRVVHNDTKISNVLFDQDACHATGVIDLDTLMPGYLMHDFGDMVRTFTPPVDENNADFDAVRVRPNILFALTNGWLDGLGDTISEKEKITLNTGAKGLILEQAIRFLHDYLAGNVYYAVEYPDQNLVRATNQIYLLESLNRQYS